MKAEDDEVGVGCAEHETGEEGARLEEPLDAGGDEVAHVVAEGAEDEDGERHDDEQIDHGGQEELQVLVHVLADGAIEQRVHHNRDKDRENRRVVVDRLKRQAEELRAGLADKLRKVGLEEGGANYGAHVGVRAQLLGGREAQEYRQEVEACIAGRRDDQIRRVSFGKDADRHEQRQKRLEHAGAAHHGDDGAEGTREELEHDVEGAALVLLRVAAVLGVLAEASEHHASKPIVVDLRADYDLVLPAAVEDLEDVGLGFEVCLVGEGHLGVLELEAQTRRAVDETHNVVFTADEVKDLACFLLVHRNLLSVGGAYRSAPSESITWRYHPRLFFARRLFVPEPSSCLST